MELIASVKYITLMSPLMASQNPRDPCHPTSSTHSRAARPTRSFFLSCYSASRRYSHTLQVVHCDHPRRKTTSPAHQSSLTLHTQACPNLAEFSWHVTVTVTVDAHTDCCFFEPNRNMWSKYHLPPQIMIEKNQSTGFRFSWSCHPGAGCLKLLVRGHVLLSWEFTRRLGWSLWDSELMMGILNMCMYIFMLDRIVTCVCMCIC